MPDMSRDRSGTGKSSLVRALVRAGAVYYSDDLAPIDPDGLVHAYARVPSPGPEDPARRLIAPPARPGKPPPLATLLIISTSFDPEATWEPRVERGARAALLLLESIITARDQPARALETARIVTATSVTLSGRRGDADVAAEQILARLDELAPGPLHPGALLPVP